jgi:uncharacterized protein (TIGR03437 family)
MPAVFVGGQAMPVLFSGLTPGIAGLWQIDVMIPNDAPTGTALTLSVEFAQLNSQITVAVQ